jgi:tetratricopeptide (TPR) repeat protein
MLPPVPNGQSAAGVDIVFGIALLGTLFMVARRWRSLWDADFTADDRRLATQCGVFVVPPVVVLIHELGHILGARMAGGRVLGFHYGLIEGSVTVAGGLSDAAFWWVALSGNLAGAGLGLALAVIGARRERLPRALRRILIFGGLLQVGFQLVMYPLISLSARFGDWISIYDFAATPALSSITAVAHAVALVAAWRWWRGPLRRLLFDIDHGTGGDVARLEAAMAAAPHDPQPAMELGLVYARTGELGLARDTLDRAAAHPALTGAGAARLHLARARLAVIEDRWSQAYLAAQEGLAAAGGAGGAGAGTDGADGANGAGGEVVQRLWANAGIALEAMQRPQQALDAFARVRPPVLDDSRIIYTRGLARLAVGDRAGGEADLRAVVGWLPEGDLLRQWAEAQLEGREPPPPDDRDRPNYARRSKAPPAPIAGV